MPIGAFVTRREIYQKVFSRLDRCVVHSTTFGRNNLAMACGLATLQVIEEEKLVEQAARNGELIMEGLADFAERYSHVKAARGRGLMLGLVLDQPVKPLCAKMAEAGLLTLATAENVVRLLPPLNVKDGEIEEALEIMDDCLAELHGTAEAGE